MSERSAQPAELERLAAQLERSASQLESTRRAVQSSIAKTDWQGIAGDSLRAAIHTVEQDIDAARRALDAMAQVLRYGHTLSGSTGRTGSTGSVGAAGSAAEREQQLGRWLSTTQLGLGAAGVRQAGAVAISPHQAVGALEQGAAGAAQREHQAVQQRQLEHQAAQLERQAAQLEAAAGTAGQAALQATPAEHATAPAVLAGQAALRADQLAQTQAEQVAQHAVQPHGPPDDAV